MHNLKTVNQLVADCPALTHGGVRWDIFHAETNGLAASGAIIRRGRRILIDEDRYYAWMRERGGQTAAAG